MEHTNVEIAVIEATINELRERESRELLQSQLAWVGGGMGETIAI